ncbi:MAG: hypothetical protein NT051_02430 [Candidatus Micrarchaeota archaeon]|nr:hypothetical protein [Candidatus Micrarchaeota archaeon]
MGQLEFVSQKGTKLAQNERKSIMDRFPSNPVEEKKFFVKMLECASLQGLRATEYFGYALKCVDGRPEWNDVPNARHGDSTFNNGQARIALENVALEYLERTKLYGKSHVIDLNVMIAFQGVGDKKNAAFSIRYEFAGNDIRLGGALFVSGGGRYDKAVAAAHRDFAGSNESQAAYLSIAGEKC